MTKIVSICNNKGGVGKTTSNILLVALLLEKGYKVLGVDLEFPGYFSRFFNGDNAFSQDNAIMSLFRDGENAPPIKINDNLSFYQSYDELGSVDAMGVESVMNYAESLRSIEGFDYIVTDTPPLLNNRLDCALSACTHVCCVIQPLAYAMDGLGSFLKKYNRTRNFLNRDLPDYPFVFFNLFSGVNSEHKEAVDQFREFYPSEYLATDLLRIWKAVSSSTANGVVIWNAPGVKKPIKDACLSVFNQVIDYFEGNL